MYRCWKHRSISYILSCGSFLITSATMESSVPLSLVSAILALVLSTKSTVIHAIRNSSVNSLSSSSPCASRPSPPCRRTPLRSAFVARLSTMPSLQQNCLQLQRSSFCQNLPWHQAAHDSMSGPGFSRLFSFDLSLNWPGANGCGSFTASHLSCNLCCNFFLRRSTACPSAPAMLCHCDCSASLGPTLSSSCDVRFFLPRRCV